LLFTVVQIEQNVIVASQFYDVADVQFTVEKGGPSNFCNSFKSSQCFHFSLFKIKSGLFSNRLVFFSIWFIVYFLFFGLFLVF